MYKLQKCLIVLFMLCLISCSSFTKEDQIKIAGMSYTGLGELLLIVGDNIKALHTQGTIDDNKFDGLAQIYNNILPMYKEAGNLQLELMKLDLNNIQIDDIQNNYDVLIDTVKTTLSQLILTLKEFGVNIKI